MLFYLFSEFVRPCCQRLTVQYNLGYSKSQQRDRTICSATLQYPNGTLTTICYHFSHISNGFYKSLLRFPQITDKCKHYNMYLGSLLAPDVVIRFLVRHVCLTLQFVLTISAMLIVYHRFQVVLILTTETLNFNVKNKIDYNLLCVITTPNCM